MLRHLTTKNDNGFDWIDLADPSDKELIKIAKAYNLHPALLNDCMQPDHLPKFETTDDYKFLIFRLYSNGVAAEADTVQELTDKIAIFYSTDFIITIHRKTQDFLYNLEEKAKSVKSKNTIHLLSAIIRLCLFTYQEASYKLHKGMDYYEENIFLKNRKISLLKGLYFLKRKVDLIRRLLILSYDIIDNVDTEDGDVDTRDTRDLYVTLRNVYDTLSDNINHLLTIYFSISAQRTNETIRILTIFSVFFMPLTFIVGIYGMNFRFMPELTSKLGYPAVWAGMLIITLIIYFWFRKKEWL